MIGYLVFPTAPPRLSDVGILDAVSGRQVDLNTGSSALSTTPTPPSRACSSAARRSSARAALATRHLMARLAGVAYPPLVLLVTVATENHSFVDARTCIRGAFMEPPAGLARRLSVGVVCVVA